MGRGNFSVSSKRGLSLIEVAVVLAVISIMVGTVLVGNSLKHKAALQRLVTDLATIQTAMDNFYDAKSAWPGDMSNATDFWTTTNGNGNSTLSGGEALFFWQHLKLAGYISGSYDGATTRPGIGLMAGPSELGITGYAASSCPSCGKGAAAAVVITFSKFVSNTGNYAVLTPTEMFTLEGQYDNGKPGTLNADENNLYNGIDGAGASGSCVLSSNYVTTNSGVACYFEKVLVPE